MISIGGIQLSDELRCPGLRRPTQYGVPVSFSFGGKEINIVSSSPTLELTALLSGNQLLGHYTLSQINSIMSLENKPHEFIHPLEPNGIDVYIDKQSVSELLPADPWATPPGALSGDSYYSTDQNFFYYGTITLERL